MSSKILCGSGLEFPKKHWVVWSVLIFVTLFCLSLKIASPGIESRRPFHYVGVAILFCYSVFFLLRFIRDSAHSFSMFRPFLSVCLILLYLFEFPRGAEDSVRSVKDYINGTAIDFGLFLTFGGSIAFMGNRPAVVDRFVVSLSLTLVVWGFISALVGWLFYNGLVITVGFLTFFHNPAWGVRLHGVHGEPTHFGATVAIALLSLIYFYHRCSRHSKFDYFWLFLASFLGATLFASGSKNSILALSVALLLMVVLSVNKLRLITAIVASLVFGPLFLTVDFSALTTFTSLHQNETNQNQLSAQNETNQNQLSTQNETNQNQASRQFGVYELIGAIRLDDEGSIGVRQRKFMDLSSAFVDLPVRDQIFGLGYGALERHELRSSFNSYLDILIRFGAIHLLLVVSFLFYVAYSIFVNIRDCGVLSSSSIYAISLYLFSVVFSMSLSTWHSTFFHVANIGFFVAFAIASVIHPIQDSALS